MLSRSTGRFDQGEKLEEYKSVPSLVYILHVDPDAPRLRLFWRETGGSWQSRLYREATATLELAALGIAFRLGDLYRGLTFRPEARGLLDHAGLPEI